MSGEGPIAYAPRHLTLSERRSHHLRRPGAIGAAAHLKPMATLALEAEEASAVPPLARVRRGHIALALSATLASLPVLVLDNLPATAETNQAQVAATAAPSDEPTTTLWTVDPPNLPAPTTTAVAPATSAPPTTAAPPPTTERPVQTDAALPPPPPTTAPPPPPAPRYGDPSDPATWERLAQCETGGNWAVDPGNGYYGGLQFSLATWQDVGGTGYPHQASKAEQITRGQILQGRAGWGAWPGCSRELGYL
ncbi:MAG: transglycosylase family protein [Acidimicrobiales bacterium]